MKGEGGLKILILFVVLSWTALQFFVAYAYIIMSSITWSNSFVKEIGGQGEKSQYEKSHMLNLC